MKPSRKHAEAWHQELTKTIDLLVEGYMQKLDHGCGMPIHPSRQAEIERLQRRADVAWKLCGPRYRARVTAEAAAHGAREEAGGDRRGRY